METLLVTFPPLLLSYSKGPPDARGTCAISPNSEDWEKPPHLFCTFYPVLHITQARNRAVWKPLGIPHPHFCMNCPHPAAVCVRLFRTSAESVLHSETEPECENHSILRAVSSTRLEKSKKLFQQVAVRKLARKISAKICADAYWYSF